MRSRGVFVLVGLLALAPWLAISAGAPGAGWQWLEYPRPTSLLAVGVSVLLCVTAEKPASSVWVLVAALAGSLIGERLELTGWSFETAIPRAAPWLVGGLHLALVVLAVTAKRSQLAAGLWLAVVGAISTCVAMANRSWLTLENLSQKGTFRHSGGWPDTKKLALGVALGAVALGLVIATRRRHDALPRATLRR